VFLFPWDNQYIPEGAGELVEPDVWKGRTLLFVEIEMPRYRALTLGIQILRLGKIFQIYIKLNKKTK